MPSMTPPKGSIAYRGHGVAWLRSSLLMRLRCLGQPCLYHGVVGSNPNAPHQQTPLRHTMNVTDIIHPDPLCGASFLLTSLCLRPIMTLVLMRSMTVNLSKKAIWEKPCTFGYRAFLVYCSLSLSSAEPCSLWTLPQL